jgi:hypothetical protein
MPLNKPLGSGLKTSLGLLSLAELTYRSAGGDSDPTSRTANGASSHNSWSGHLHFRKTISRGADQGGR